MFCPQCGSENPDGVRFCGDCGANLTSLAPAVGTPTREDAATEKPWFEKWWGIFLLVILSGILGAIALYFLWRSSLPKTVKWGLSVIIVAASWYLQYRFAGSDSAMP